MMKKIFIVLFLIAGVLTVQVSAEEVLPENSGEAAAVEISAPGRDYVFPTIKPEAYLRIGYGYIHVSGDRKVSEFEFPHSSVTLGGEVRFVNERHRLHLDAEYNNRKDYEGDLSYAFRDIVLFRWINSTLYHNLDNTPPVDLDPSTATTAAVQVFDKGQRYGRTVGINSLLLRLKLPDFPAHLYFEGFFVDKEGTQQQKFLGGAASFRSGTTRVSQKRDTDLETRIYTVGANSHLGPIEIDYSHSEKRLNVGHPELVYTYSASASPVFSAGAYAHNGIPELKSSTDTLKIHTTYTGQIAASATLSKTGKENRENSAQADFLFGAADFTYLPSDRITMFLKYRHKETEKESPDVARLTNLTNSTVYTSNVYKPISSVSDFYAAVVRFRALRNVTLKGELNIENIRRDNSEEWNTPDRTEKTTMIFSSDMKLYKSLKLKLKYTHKNINDPAHNIEPDASDEIYASLSWAPLRNLTTFLSYDNRHERRDSVHYLYASGGIDYDLLFGARKVDNERLTGVINYMPLNNMSVTGSYSFGRTKTKQDLTYACNSSPGICANAPVFPELPSGTPFPDAMVPFRTVFQTFGLDLTFQPSSSLTLNGGLSHTTAQGRFSPSNVLGQKSIDDFSELKTRETIYSASGEYRLRNGFGIALNYRYATFKDAYDNMLDDVKDGRVHDVFLTLSKKW